MADITKVTSNFIYFLARNFRVLVTTSEWAQVAAIRDFERTHYDIIVSTEGNVTTVRLTHELDIDAALAQFLSDDERPNDTFPTPTDSNTIQHYIVIIR